jgi:diadenosine tetraphosphate (Ap4A) HIT family hydrolase
VSVPGCLACDFVTGRQPLPGGVIHDAGAWIVEHCVGPLGVGTLIVKPRRHVTAVADLTEDEAAALGPLLRRATQVVTELIAPEQTYVTLWSHAGGVPVHIHFVIQPITVELMQAHGVYGPTLQVAMFEAGELPAEPEVEVFAERARVLFSPSGR